MGEKGGLPNGIGGIARLSGELSDISSDARYELRCGSADGVLGDMGASGCVVSDTSSPDSEPGLGDLIGGGGGIGRATIQSDKAHITRND